jgi:hypothetical protein
VRPGVGDAERAVTDEANPLWGVEARVGGGAVGESKRASEDLLDARAAAARLQATDEDAMVAAVGDGDAGGRRARIIDRHLAGVAQKRRSPRRRRVADRQMHRVVRERPRLARLRERRLDERVDRLGCELAGVCPDDVTAGVDGDERRPRAHGVGAPDAELPVVQHRMSRAEPDRRLADAVSDALRQVLAAVHSDDRDVPRVLLLELPQLRKYVDAVDSAVRPEVEEEQLPAEVGEREATAAGVDPVHVGREVGRADRGGVDLGHWTWRQQMRRKISLAADLTSAAGARKFRRLPLPVASILAAAIGGEHRRRDARHPHDRAGPPVDPTELDVQRVEGEPDPNEAQESPEHDLAEYARILAPRVAPSLTLAASWLSMS